MSYKGWIILMVVAIIAIFLFFKTYNTENKEVNINNINIPSPITVKTATIAPTVPTTTTVKQNNMKIESEVFVNNGKIPVEYTCNGQGMQPPLKVSDVPQGAKSLALIVDDPDAPNGDFVHWVVWNIDPKISVIENGAVPGAIEGYTGLDKPGWVAPCPPSGVHHYNFRFYALDVVLAIPNSSTKADLLNAMDKHIVSNATLIGLYGKN